MQFIQVQDEIPVRGEYDVIVAGAGVAGVAAALAARRCGKSVLLIEKSVNMGGLATIGLINFFVPMCNGRGVQIVKGMADELLRMSLEYSFDTLPEEWKSGDPGEGAKTRLVNVYSAQIFALQLAEAVRKEGVDVLLDTVVSKPVMKGKHCEGLILENKSGREYYGAKMIVDATGDADVLYRAGVPTVQGKNFFTYTAKEVTLAGCQRAVDAQDIGKMYSSRSGGGASLYGHNQMEGVPLYDGTTVESVTDYILKNQQILLDRLKPEDRKSREIVTLPTMAQFRTTRRIDGDYVLKIFDAYHHFEDSVGAINDFDHRDYLYEIPYRCLIHHDYDNLITAGRTAAGEGYAWDVLRVIPPAILSGQAAGVACSEAIDQKCGLPAIDIPHLQKILEEAGVMIHFDDALVPADLEHSGETVDVGHI